MKNVLTLDMPELNRRAVVRCLSMPLMASAASITKLSWAQSRPPRLITAGGGITEIAYLLGAQDQLVGTDTTSLYPAAALKTAKVGYMRQLSAEGLLSLRPDAMIATTEAGPPVVIDQIRSAGVRVELIEADHSWAEVQRKIAAVARLGAREREGLNLRNRLDTEWAAVLAEVAKAGAGAGAKKGGKKPRVVFILANSQTPSVSGASTAADAMIRFCGATNALADNFKGYRPMTAEAMAAAAPDIILTSSSAVEAQGGAEKFWSRPELALTPAYKRRALVHMESLKMLGFGPRMAEAVRELHQKVVLA